MANFNGKLLVYHSLPFFWNDPVLLIPPSHSVRVSLWRQGQLYAESPKAAKKEAATFVTDMCPGSGGAPVR